MLLRGVRVTEQQTVIRLLFWLITPLYKLTEIWCRKHFTALNPDLADCEQHCTQVAEFTINMSVGNLTLGQRLVDVQLYRETTHIQLVSRWLFFFFFHLTSCKLLIHEPEISPFSHAQSATPSYFETWASPVLVQGCFEYREYLLVLICIRCRVIFPLWCLLRVWKDKLKARPFASDSYFSHWAHTRTQCDFFTISKQEGAPYLAQGQFHRTRGCWWIQILPLRGHTGVRVQTARSPAAVQ